jgi:hypothetical protein
MSETVKLTEAREAAKLPAVRTTLQDIASGRMVISLDIKRQCGELESFDGHNYRDPESPERKLLVAGAYTLFVAGYLTQFGTITDAGRLALRQKAPDNG